MSSCNCDVKLTELSSENTLVVVGVKDCYRCDIFRHRNTMIQPITLTDKSIGFGDTLQKLLQRAGVESCVKCKIRQSLLNKWFPYFWKPEWRNKIQRKFKNLALRSGETIYPILLDDYGKVYPIEEVDKEFEDVIKSFEEEYGLSVD